jgi:hypothetical protein
MVYCPDVYISWATWSLWMVMTEGRPPWRPRARAAARPAVVRSRMRSRSNSARLGEDVEDELAAGGGGVDRLLEAAEPDAALSQAGDGVDQMSEGAAEPVQFPDHQGVTGPELVQ